MNITLNEVEATHSTTDGQDYHERSTFARDQIRGGIEEVRIPEFLKSFRVAIEIGTIATTYSILYISGRSGS